MGHRSSKFHEHAVQAGLPDAQFVDVGAGSDQLAAQPGQLLQSAPQPANPQAVLVGRGEEGRAQKVPQCRRGLRSQHQQYFLVSAEEPADEDRDRVCSSYDTTSENGHTISQRLSLHEIVGGENQTHTPVPEALEYTMYGLAGDWIQADCRFVEQQQVGSVKGARRDVDAPLHAAGKPLDRLRGAISEPRPGQRVCHCRCNLATVETCQSAENLQIGADRQVAPERDGLGYEADAPAHGPIVRGAATNADAAGIEPGSTGQRAEESGLAGAVWPQENQYLALSCGEIRASQRRALTKAAQCATDDNQGLGRDRQSPNRVKRSRFCPNNFAPTKRPRILPVLIQAIRLPLLRLARIWSTSQGVEVST